VTAEIFLEGLWGRRNHGATDRKFLCSQPRRWSPRSSGTLALRPEPRSSFASDADLTKGEELAAGCDLAGGRLGGP